MSPGSIFCEYIYGSFLLVEAALEATMSLTKTTLTMLSTMFDACISLFRFTIDVAVKTIIDGVKVIQKLLIDLLWDGYKDGGKSKFCNNLYKCNIFIEELTNANSLICKTLIGLGVITAEQQRFANNIISDFDAFQETVCNFGFTFNFGISALKKLLNFYKNKLNGFIDIIERKKEDIRRFIQKYINLLEDCGIFDLLAKLRKFFNCILDMSDSCSSLHTAKNFYTDCLTKMKIEEAGTGGYKLESGLSNMMLNSFDARLNQINNYKVDIQKAIDALISPSTVKAASKAFNLSKNVFPGGMSLSDIKNGNWNKNRMVRYFSIKIDTFMDVFVRRHQAQLPEGVSTDYILNGMRINDKTGKITVVTNIFTEEIDMNDSETSEIYAGAIDEHVLQTPLDYFVTNGTNPDGEDALYYNGQVISSLRTAVEISCENNKELEKLCNETVAGITGLLKESELAVIW